jgi:hypothetical protein
MEYVIGAAMALVVCFAAHYIGFDRDRSFYPTVMIVIASYYALFAVIGGPLESLLIELAVMAVFVGITIAGFKMSLWLVVAALVAHGVFDLIHGHLIKNPGVPSWWPGFCLAYDLTAAGYLSRLIKQSGSQAANAQLDAD